RSAYVVTWAVLIVAGFVTSLGLLGGASLFDRLETGDIVAPGQATQGRDLLTATDEGAAPVLLRADGVDFPDPPPTLHVRAVVRRLEGIEGVGEVTSPMTTPGWPRAPEAYALIADNDPASGSFMISVEAGTEPGNEVQEAVMAELEGTSSYLLARHADELHI